MSAAVLLICAAAVAADRSCAQSAPAKPTGFAAEDGNTQVRLSWTGPSDSTITGWQYTYKRKTAGSYPGWTDMPGSGADTRRFTVTGLINNIEYKFKVRAVNPVGNGRESDEKIGWPYPAPPEKPTGFKAAPGDRSVLLTWNDADDISINGWEYRQKEADGSYGGKIPIPGSDETTTSHTVTGLKNGTRYSFKIMAYNSDGDGYFSDEKSATPTPQAPAKPTGFSAEAGNRKVTLSWNDPDDGTIASWQYAYKTTGDYGDWTDMAGSGAATVRHVVSMLENDTSYTFRIRAVNSVGGGAESDEVSATPMAAAPEKPTGFAVRARDAQVALSWTDPSDASIRTWQYAYKTTGDYGDWTDIPDSRAKTTGHTVSELTNGTAYTFKVRGVNDVGPGPESDEASATPLAVPAKPGGFTVKAGDAQATLEWTDPGNDTITGWQYAYKTTGAYGSWTNIPGSGAATAAYTVTGLDNDVGHTFKLRAVNASGEGAESDEAAATPIPVPAKPSGFRTEAGNKQVRLLWTDPADSSITGWRYRYKTSGDYGGWTDIPGSGASTVRYTVTGLANGTAHTFRLRAVNGSGDGPQSDEASATPELAPPEKPTGFRVAPGDGRAVLTWNDPDDSSIEGWQYRKRADGEEYGQYWTNIPGSDATTVRHTVTGLDNGKTYFFVLRAVNYTNGVVSDERSAALPPAKPAGFTATPGDRQVALAWTDPDNDTITGWQYARKTTGDYGAWTTIPKSGAATTAYAVKDLDNDTTYTFKLRAVNPSGNGAESDEATATPVAVPAKPTGFSATPGDSLVALAWTDPDNDTITGWQYAQKTTDNYSAWKAVPNGEADTTAYTVTGLENSTAYAFKLRAVNPSGNGEESNEVSATPIAVPAKPTGFSATPGDSQVTLAWTDPGNDTITGWQYAQKATGDYGTWKTVPNSGADTAAYAVTGLENDTAYTFKLRAVNPSGDGTASDEATATPVAVPAKPTGLTATAGDGQVALSWTDPGNDTITGWQYAQKTTGDYGAWKTVPNGGADTAAYTVTGLDNDTAYSFKLRAANASGNGTASDEATATPIAVPAKPTGFTATPGDGQVALAWTDPDNDTITGWQYAQKTTGNYSAWKAVPNSGADTAAYTVTGLENDTAYTFKLRAVNPSGNGTVSDEATATPIAVPAKPTGFTATPGDSQVALAWTDPDNDTITGWQYAYKTTGGYGEWKVVPNSGADTAAYTVTGLDNGTAYTFKLRAANASGNGTASDEATATPIAVPAKPTGFTATPGDGQVALAWTDPDNDTITGWQYAQKTAGKYGAWTTIPKSGATTTAYMVKDLENDTAYAFKLRAVNPSGNGEESNEVSATPIAVPAKPTGFSATPGDSQVTLAWTDPGNDTITGWQYAQKTTGDYGAWKTVPNSGADTAAYAVTGLENDTAYTFKLRAVNPSGDGTASDEATATPVAVPAKPTGLTATAGDAQVQLAWDDPSNDTITGWQYAQKTAGKYGAWTTIPKSGATTTAYMVKDLDNDTAYAFKLRAANASGNGAESDEATATPIAVPAKPTGFTATPGDSQVALAWTDPDNDTITGWQYAQKTTGGYGAWKAVSNSGSDTTAYTVTGLDNDTAYTFKLRAVNASGNGTASDEATATPVAVPAKPTGLTATAGDAQVQLAWDDPSDTTITGWRYAYKTTGGYGEWTDISDSGAATVSHTVTGLDNGKSHTFKLRAVNPSGDGTASDEATATPVAVPAKPTGFTATPGDGQVALSWTDPGNDTITGWQYAQKTTGDYGAWKTVPNSGADTAAYTVTGLDNDTAYSFKLRAANASGNGTASDEATATPIAVPAKPTGFTATPGDGQVALAWTDPDNDTITGWQYAQKTTGNYSAWKAVPNSGADTAAYTVTGLENDTAYTFKLRAVNPSGNGTVSDEATATPIAVPAKPTGFTATPGDSQVALAWTDPDNDTITGWQYAYKTTGGYGEWKVVPNSGADTAAYTVTGLDNGTAYTFKLRAANASGNGTASDEATATPIAVPAKPTGFTATPGDSQVALAWTDPGNDTITGWQYAQKTAGKYGAWTTIPKSGATTTAYTVKNLDNDTAYAFKLRAVNPSGDGTASDEATATPIAVPAKPTGFAATPGDGQVALAWTDPGNTTITGWQYAQKTTGDYGAWKTVPNSGSDTAAYTVTGLENDTAYTFKLRAANASGNGAESDEATATPIAVPAKPTGLTATAGDAQVRLAWDDPSNDTITGWQYAQKTAGKYGAWTTIPKSGATTTAYMVKDLDNDTAYAFKLRAANASGNGAESDEATATPIAVPAKPTGFTATPGDSQVALAWTDPDNDTITGWQYAQKTTGGYGAWKAVSNSGSDTTAYTVTGLDNDTAYTFKLRAVNPSGNGTASDEATATPVAVPAKPTGLTATAGDAQVQLAWTDPGNDTITGWQYAQKTTGNYSAWKAVPNSGSDTAAYTVTGLDNDTAYTFKLRAVNPSGDGTASDEATATPIPVPAKPTGLKATPGAEQAQLEWDAPGDSTITGWEYNQRPAGGEFEQYWTYILGSNNKTKSYTVIGLETGKSYDFKLRAVNASGASAESNIAVATLPPVPAKPAGLTATPGDGQVALKWTDPDNSTITDWQYAGKTAGVYGSWTDIPNSEATTTDHTVTALDNGVEHKFRIRALNSSGTGAPSGEAAATPLAVPAKPAGLTATPGSGEVALSWDNPNNATITGWQYNQRPENGEYEADWTAILGSTATTVRHTVTGLETGASYRFKLRAGNASGPGAESDEIAVTLPPVPAKPAGLTATAGDRRVSLAWTALGDSTVARWQYRYRTESGGYGGWIDIDASEAETKSHTVAGLAVGIPHHFRIRAVNSSGEGAESDEAAATPFALPAQPAGFTATAGAGEVVLSWDDPNDQSVTGWKYNQRRAGGEFEKDWTQIPNSHATSYTVTGLETGVSYGFKLRAIAGEHEGPESVEATATVALPAPPARPAGFTATPGDGEVALAWSKPDNLPISGWQYRYGPAGDYSEWIDIPGSAAKTAHTVTGLEYGVSYAFRVRAFNAGGNGEESLEATATSLPARPTGFTATPGDREMLLEWDDPGDPSVTHWEYKQRQADEPFGNEWTVLPKDATPTRFTVPSLEIGASYAFKLRAVNAGGAGAETGEVATTVPPVPARPEGFALIPGEREVSLEWKALGDPTVTVWQYKYRIGSNDGDWTDIPGSGPDTNGYTVTGLEAGVSHKFRIRAANSSGFGLASDEIATAPLGRPARPTGLTATPGYGQVVLTWSDPGDPAIVRWQYVVRTEEDRAPDKWLDMAGSGPRTRRYVVEALESGVAYIFRVRVCASEDRRHPVCGPGSDPVSATPKAAATPAERKTVKAVLASLAGHVAAGADAMIGARFSADPARSSVVLAGREVPLFAPVRKEWMQTPPGGAPKATVRGIGGRELLQDSSFQVALGPPGGEGLPQWSLWHRGELTRFEGSAGAGSRYGGRLLSFWYGADMRWGERWLAGAALARSKAEADYAGGGEAGRLKTVLDSVHPYLLRRFEGGGTAWIALGGGRGTIENETAGRDIETADTELATASAGFRARLPAFGGLKLSASGAAGFARLEAGGDARTAIGSLSASTNRQSLGIEAAPEEGDAAYRTSLSLRRNGGDGANGIGLEVTKSVEAALPSLSGRAAVRTRWLVWNSDGEYREVGVAAAVRRPAGPDGRGLSWSLSVAQGTPGGAARGPGSFWREEAPERGGGGGAFSLDLSAGWGFVSRGGAFTPRAAFGLAGANDRRLALGLDIGPPSGPRLKLAARRRIPRRGAPESRIAAAVQFRF